MDLSHEERTLNARAAYQQTEARVRRACTDKASIARILAAFPVDSVDQWLHLGGACPYWPTQRREREAWCAEINRQRSEFAGVTA